MAFRQMTGGCSSDARVAPSGRRWCPAACVLPRTFRSVTPVTIMWPFKKKQPSVAEPQLRDQALLELSQMFLHYPADPTPGSESLEVRLFDYSVGSLGAMDEHLEKMRTREFSERDWNSFTLRAGAYVGEVIRRHTPAPKRRHWLDYTQAAALQPIVASMGMSVGTAAVLWDGKAGVTFPLAKVAKYIQNGAEDSVKFYAQVVIADPPSIASPPAEVGRGRECES